MEATFTTARKHSACTTVTGREDDLRVKIFTLHAASWRPWIVQLAVRFLSAGHGHLSCFSDTGMDPLISIAGLNMIAGAVRFQSAERWDQLEEQWHSMSAGSGMHVRAIASCKCRRGLSRTYQKRRGAEQQPVHETANAMQRHAPDSVRTISSRARCYCSITTREIFTPDCVSLFQLWVPASRTAVRRSALQSHAP